MTPQADHGEDSSPATSASKVKFERAAQPAEIAPLFVFLASQDATYVTAEIYGATGGKTPY